jgi:hypothetical protein
MSDWSLILSTDATGSITFGSVSALKVAVQSAADIKILYKTGDEIWWARQCLSASVREVGGTTLVTATYLEAINTRLGANGVEFEVPIALEYHIYNSNGWRNRSTAGKIDSEKIPMRWYVRDYQPNWMIHADAISTHVDRGP